MFFLPFLKLKLRIKFLILFLAIALIPLLLVMSIAILRLQAIQQDNTVKLSRQIAQTATEEIQRSIVSQFGVLDSIATIYPEFSSNPTIQDSLVERILYTSNSFTDISIVNAVGLETSRKNLLKVVSSSELTDRGNSPEFISVKNNGYFLGPVMIENGKAFFTIGKQIVAKDRSFRGAVFAEVDARIMQDVVKKISSVGKEGRAYIVDQKGTVIAHPDFSEVLAQKSFAEIPVVKSIVDNQADASLKPYFNENKDQVLGASFPIVINFNDQSNPLDTHWFVLVEKPVSVALQSVYEITRFTLVTLFAVMLVSAFTAVLFTNRIVGPIEKVHSASRQFGHGNLDYRVSVHTQDEIEDLANEFNNMASFLQHNINQLSSQNRLLTALRRLDVAGLTSNETKSLCEFIVDVLRKELQYSTAIIALIDQKESVLKRVSISKFDNPNLEATLESLPIKFENQILPLSFKSNLLIQCIDERRSLYTDRLYDIQRGILNEEVSDKIQRDNQLVSIYVYPLIAKNRVIGTLTLITAKNKELMSSVELTIMEEISAEVARILDNALLYQNLREDREVISSERNKLAISLASIADAVIAIDLSRKVVIFNPAAERLTDYSEKEVIGRPIDEIIKMYEGKNELLPVNYCPVKITGRDGITLSKKDLRLVGKNGKGVYVNLVAGQIKEGEKSNLGCILTFHDVTKERQLEAMKLDFVSMAAHELRTPLTSVRGYLSILQSERVLEGEHKQFLDRAIVSADQLVDLVENLLSVSKIERGAVALNFKAMDWPSFVGEVVTEFKERAGEKHIDLNFASPTMMMPPVKADSLRIREVLVNLISNALNYTSPGGKVEVSIEVKEKEILTHVKDNGEGIPQDAIPHLFTKFFRVSGILEQGSKGTGLGLYISKQIVMMHRGRIWVASELGKGSTFSFALPII